MKSKDKICLVIPGLSPGGAERVMSVIANEFSKNKDIEVHLLLYVKPNVFYDLDKSVVVHKVDFDYKKLPRILFTIKILLFLRSKFKEIKPNSFLSFGGKFNSFVLIASYGLGIKGYISDRSRPGIKYGFLPDLLNPYAYRLSKGFIAQTKAAEYYITKKVKNINSIVIPNPIPTYQGSSKNKQNIILNVGRFIRSKQQDKLIKMFMEINPKDWILEFVGSGQYLEYCKDLVKKNGFEDKIRFYKNTNNIDFYYEKSKIFAFTSESEGFPNSLAEAMAAECACISYNCLAGPADIIKDGYNGYLVEINNSNEYKDKLKKLINNSDLLQTFAKNGVQKSKEFESSYVSKKYLQFIKKS